MRIVSFRYFGRVAHFLRAEMNASALSYPVPPRTVLLGLLGNILGFTKDDAPHELGEARVGIGAPVPGGGIASGRVYPPRRHYHCANLRKAFPAALPLWPQPAKPGAKLPDPTGLGAVSQVIQEWLLDPEFTVYVGAEPMAEWFVRLEACLREGRSHFTPCLGLAWMIAEVRLVQNGVAEPLPPGTHPIRTVCRHSAGQIDPSQMPSEGLAVQELRMPRSVTSERIFTHESYYLEMNGRPLPVRTREPGQAWSFGKDVIAFL